MLDCSELEKEILIVYFVDQGLFLFFPTLYKSVNEPLHAEVTFTSSTCNDSTAAID